MTMTSDNGSSAELLPEAEITSVSALARHRQAFKQRLLDGATGAELMAALTEFVDGLVRDRYRSAMKQAGEGAQVAGSQHCCLIALGGYGLRELAPYSDIDIMFLYSEEAGEAAPALFREVLHHLWDFGFQVGHSMRTIQDCIELRGGSIDPYCDDDCQVFGRKPEPVPEVPSPVCQGGRWAWSGAIYRAEDGRAAT